MFSSFDYVMSSVDLKYQLVTVDANESPSLIGWRNNFL